MSGGRTKMGRVRQARATEQQKRARWASLAPVIAIAGVMILALGGVAAWRLTAPPPMLGGAFQMADQDGKPVDQRLLDGKWSAVFFGYTYCPDVCPTTLQALGQARMLMADRGKDLQVVFVTVDPERDSAPALKTYLTSQKLPVPTVGLTGTAAQLKVMAKAYKVYYAKVQTGATYAMDHSSAIYLMDPSAKYVAPLSPDMAPDKLAYAILKAEGRI